MQQCMYPNAKYLYHNVLMHTVQPDLTILYKIPTFIYIWLVILALITFYKPNLATCSGHGNQYFLGPLEHFYNLRT